MANTRTLDIVTIAVPKASDVLAESLRERILDDRLPEGTKLPTERELVLKSGLSRTSVREALRVLEIEGLVTTKAGRNGGSMTRRPTRDSISRSIELFLRSHGVRLEALVEVREAVEPAAARLAAVHRTEADLEELRRIHEDMTAVTDDVRQFVKLNLQWHFAVVKASRNELLITFFTAISRPIHAATEYHALNTSEMRREVAHAHKGVLDAIAAKDDAAAFRRMARHVGAYSQTVQQLAEPA